MPLYCCDCNCGSTTVCSRLERFAGRTSCCSDVEIESADEKRRRLNLLESRFERIDEQFKLEKLKDATKEIKKLIDKVDDNLELVKARRENRLLLSEIRSCKVCEQKKSEHDIVKYLDRNCKDEQASNTYYCCNDYRKTSNDCDDIVELIRHKHNYHRDSLSAHPAAETCTSACISTCTACNRCHDDARIKRGRTRSRSRSRSRRLSRSRSRCRYSDTEDEGVYYVSSSNSSCVGTYEQKEPWRSGAYSSSYPWTAWKINEMKNA